MADIVELFPNVEKADHDAPLTRKARDRGKFCNHKRLELNDENRRVYCRECGDEVPAFDALMDLTHNWERYVYARKEAARAAERARKEQAEAERKERNAKARLRRLAKKGVNAELRGVAAKVRKIRLPAKTTATEEEQAGYHHGIAMAAQQIENFLTSDLDE